MHMPPMFISATVEPTTPPTPSPPQVYAPPPVTTVLTILIMVLFFVGFFTLYFCKCFMENVLSDPNSVQQAPGTVDPDPEEPPGLDPSIISSFPTFPYSSVKGYRREKYGLECAICLCEFDDKDLLRLLTRCCHVFHQECIDLWLESHRSCPVCRRGLDGTRDKDDDIKSGQGTYVTTMDPTNDVDSEAPGSDHDCVRIMIKEEDEATQSAVRAAGKGDGTGVQFSRSRSTGHSILRSDHDNDQHRDKESEIDKYTLRLPEEVKERLLTTRSHHHTTVSCTTFGEYSRKSTRSHGCFGEISGGCGGGSSGCADADHRV
ncbi:hypothetical protein Droror1_Dr00025509 [Drosera rotundifolia]